MRNTASLVWVLISLAALFTACAPAPQTPVAGGEIIITDILSSLSGQPGSTSEQVFAYSVTLQNVGTRNVLLQSVDPVILDPLLPRVKNSNLKVILNVNLTPQALTVANGEIHFEASGMSKEEISRLIDAGFPASFKVDMEKVLDWNG